MGRREFDILVFGASGFTGQYVALDLAKRALSMPNLRWALAGRSSAKLQEVYAKIVAALPAYSSQPAIPIVLADVRDVASLDAMSQRTQVLLNCTGPYEYFGEPVVASCVQHGTHYLDITGEAHFILEMMAKYDADAKANDALVVSAMGFDSVPTEVCAAFASAQFPPHGRVMTSEVLMGVDSSHGHATTYECVVLMANPSHRAKTRHYYNALRAQAATSAHTRLSRYLFSYDARIGKFAAQFLGADAYLLELSNPGVETQVYFYVQHFGYVLLLAMFGLLLGVVAWCEAGRRLLIKYPSFFTAGAFTHAGPTDDEMAAASFTHFCIARGYEDAAKADGALDWQVKVRLDGPEPGYVATPICLVEAALVVVQDGASEKRKLPRGVLTPGAAFKHSDYIAKLQSRGLEFSILSAGPI
ncbi:saccharopine dehydrogenase [Saprolegnia parasitica CBS 223.65]|uniref:Saccharopine dehydrogenase n=1 Tax=Saprolegnia parasitica (strain CBS 223.65) TaxID=695850 RepID=A0A067CMV8_SAPPC|nr:saccharopine dehydrogenase [Saprolegnia parasitica CBS 223.65]KDO27871.1 saccharopine dehydrogenase [Saprolegnia parasitica CBS 223.65]|eukprot:XP_012201329.1 saccharopine dehydrogenase [Saprolegnia parasitica CBS 223.65]